MPKEIYETEEDCSDLEFVNDNNDDDPDDLDYVYSLIANRTDKLNEDTTPVVVSSLNESATFDRGKL
ncbi:unnamed protein product [Rhizophagus irregularis]|nr:unnamed protein product [Rhizophagus irregularis]